VLRFTEDHLWVRVDDESTQIGVSEYGQDELGEFIAVELPEVGEAIERGAPFGEVESVRTVQELVAPVSGTVTAVNAELDEHPELLNEDPYHDGWLIEVKLDDESELEDLLSADEYEESVSADEE
jgi:glycine cleavage system H protein